MSPKSIPFEALDDIHKVVLDRISENMASLVRSGMYDAINIDDTKTNVLYAIKFIPDAYTLQNNTTIDGQVISSGELFFRAQYLFFMQENNNWYWKQQPLKQNIIFSTLTILHQILDVITIRYVQYIPKNICNRIKSKQSIQRHPSIMTDTDYNYILDEIERHEKLSF